MTAATSAPKPTLRTGQRVILQGLEKSPELNGHRGVIVRWREDVGRYAVRVAGKEIGLRPENLAPEGGAVEAAKRVARTCAANIGTMYHPEIYARVPGAGPSMTHWIGQVKAGRRIIVRAEKAPSLEDQPVPLWFGDLGFVNSAPVEVALLIGDIGSDPAKWPDALARVLENFPVAAGRLRKHRGRGAEAYQIVLNNAGVPFTTASVPPCGLPSAEALQVTCFDDQSSFFDSAQAESGEEEEPLLRMKLIYEEGTMRGILGVTFHHVLCDIAGLATLLRCLHSQLNGSTSPIEICHDRAAVQLTFESLAPTSLEEAEHFEPFWPLSSRALERWCFLARRLRCGLRGRPDGVATLSLSISSESLAALKHSTEVEDVSPSSFEVLVCHLAQQLLKQGRRSHRVLVTKDYRVALAEEASVKDFEQLFANVVTHGLSFEVPSDSDELFLPKACSAMRQAIEVVTLPYVSWQSKQDHYRGLPNMFGGLCCNTWGRSLADLDFIEAYAIGSKSVDERAARMVFPLDAAYMQVLPQPSGSQRILLTMPVTDLGVLLKELSQELFQLPHVSEIRTHAFRVPLPAKITDRLNPAVETHHVVARIACVGDSITACGYPKFLQALFDKANLNVQVRNFGVAGTTALRFSDQPFWEERKLEDVRQWRPHFVVTTFGTNDAKSGIWDQANFEKDYADLCVEFLSCAVPKPEMFLVVPPPVYVDGAFDIQQVVVSNDVPSAVQNAANAAERAINAPLEEKAKKGRFNLPLDVLAKTVVIDAFTMLGGSNFKRRSYFAEDGVHLNERGTRLLALLVFADIRQQVSRDLRRRADAASIVPPDPLGL